MKNLIGLLLLAGAAGLVFLARSPLADVADGRKLQPETERGYASIIELWNLGAGAIGLTPGVENEPTRAERIGDIPQVDDRWRVPGT